IFVERTYIFSSKAFGNKESDIGFVRIGSVVFVYRVCLISGLANGHIIRNDKTRFSYSTQDSKRCVENHVGVCQLRYMAAGINDVEWSGRFFQIATDSAKYNHGSQ